jgi:hypothetical protein
MLAALLVLRENYSSGSLLCLFDSNLGYSLAGWYLGCRK